MPRKKKTRRPHDGGGSVFRLDNGLWRAQVPYKVLVEGVEKRRYRSEDHDTRGEAEVARERLLHELSAPKPVQDEQTLGAYLQWWLVTVVPQRDVKSSAITDYAYAIRRVVPVLGETRLCALTTDHGDTLVLKLKETLAPRTVHKTICVLNDALNGAVRRKKLANNPFVGLDLPKIPRYRPVVLRLHEIQRFREAVQGHRYALVYDLCLYLGMREGEVLGMQWANLNWQTGAYHITHDLDQARTELDTLKTEKARRTLYLPPALLQSLRIHYLDQHHLAASDNWNADGLIFCSSRGTPVRSNNLWRHFKRVCAAVGLPESTTIHHLRHTFRHYAADHMPAHVAMAWMGHSEVSTTFEVYGEGATDRAKQAVAAHLDTLYGDKEE